MLEKLDEIVARHDFVSQKLQQPGIVNNQTQFREWTKELADLDPIVDAIKRYKKLNQSIADTMALINSETDDEMQTMAKDELQALRADYASLEQQIQLMLIPKDPNDDRNVVLEIRPGAGGDEAALFAEELYRAYSLFAADQKWRTQLISWVPGNVGGVKEVIATISGDRVYSRLKYESGVHRVQRVPKTESQGRVHTSTVTVAVLPEAEEVDIQIDQKDLRIDVYRSSGHGGQSVNTTDSAVRVTHLPSGLVVTCQDGKSQLSNKQQALKVLYSRLLAIEEERKQKEASDARLSQIGTGDRSERIRTYNFPQSRLTDHRIGLTIHQLNEVMNGRLDLVMDELLTYYQVEALKRQMS